MTRSRWFQVFTVDSFVFFGTADKTYQQLKAHLERQAAPGVPRAERVKMLVFDLSGVTGIDPTAEGAFVKMRRLLASARVTAVWAEPRAARAAARLVEWGLYHDCRCQLVPGACDGGAARFASLDLALKHVEDALLARAQRLSEKWFVGVPTAEALRRHQLFASVFSISVRPTDPLGAARLLPWAEKRSLAAGERVCGAGDGGALYLLYVGAMSVSSHNGLLDSRVDTAIIFPGAFFNLDQLFVAMGVLPGPASTVGAVALEPSVVLRVSQTSFRALPHRRLRPRD